MEGAEVCEDAEEAASGALVSVLSESFEWDILDICFCSVPHEVAAIAIIETVAIRE